MKKLASYFFLCCAWGASVCLLATFLAFYLVEPPYLGANLSIPLGGGHHAVFYISSQTYVAYDYDQLARLPISFLGLILLGLFIFALACLLGTGVAVRLILGGNDDKA